MASRYFGWALGASKSEIVEAAATTAKPVEVVIDLAVIKTQEDAMKAIDLIRDRIKQGIWPPA